MHRKAFDRYVGPVVTGPDVSSYQDPDRTDWTAVRKAGHGFAFVRVADGVTRDTAALKHLRGAANAGLKVGAYIYARGDRPGEEQARLVRRVIDDSGVKLSLPVVVDFERKSTKNLPGGLYLGQSPTLPIDIVMGSIVEMLDALIADGTCEDPMIYGGEALHWLLSQERPDLAEKLSRFLLWIASHGVVNPLMPVDRKGKPFPWKAWTFWQYTSKASVAGMPTLVDMNRFRGSFGALEAFSAGHPICR